MSPLPLLLAEHMGLSVLGACWILSVVATWGRVKAETYSMIPGLVGVCVSGGGQGVCSLGGYRC